MTKIKDDIKSYQILLDQKNKEIEFLKFKLENLERVQNAKCCECERDAIQDLSDIHFKTMPFNDDYFKGLNYEDIANLAKKSIRITDDNCKLEHILDEILELANNALNRPYSDSYIKDIKKIIQENKNQACN